MIHFLYITDIREMVEMVRLLYSVLGVKLGPPKIAPVAESLLMLPIVSVQRAIFGGPKG